MTTVYTNIPQTISQFIPELGKNQVVSIQTLDKDNNIVYRSFNVYSFTNNTFAKDIRLIELGFFSPIYQASSYYQITQEFVINTYSSTQEVINNILQPSFYTWDNTTVYLNSQRQLANREKLTVIWDPPPLTEEEIALLSPEQIEDLLQPFTIQIGDVYGVTIPSNCRVLSPTNLNPNLLIDVDQITIKPLTLEQLTFSFRGVDVISIELPIKTITDNPKLLYPKTLNNPPKIPPNITGLNTNFPSLNETRLSNYNARRNRQTGII